MERLPLCNGVVFEKWLDVLPASKLSHVSKSGRDHVDQAVPSGVAKNRPFHVCGHDLPPVHEHLARIADGGLCYVERIVVVLREAEGNSDLVLAGRILDQLHLR